MLIIDIENNLKEKQNELKEIVSKYYEVKNEILSIKDSLRKERESFIDLKSGSFIELYPSSFSISIFNFNYVESIEIISVSEKMVYFKYHGGEVTNKKTHNKYTWDKIKMNKDNFFEILINMTPIGKTLRRYADIQYLLSNVDELD